MDAEPTSIIVQSYFRYPMLMEFVYNTDNENNMQSCSIELLFSKKWEVKMYLVGKLSISECAMIRHMQ